MFLEDWVQEGWKSFQRMIEGYSMLLMQVQEERSVAIEARSGLDADTVSWDIAIVITKKLFHQDGVC